MNYVGTIIHRTLFRAICIAMVIIIGGSLFSAGAMNAADCGMQCCCKVNSMNMQSLADKSMRSMNGCCSGDEVRPCDIQNAKPYELPPMSLAFCYTDVFSADGNAAALTGTTDIQIRYKGQFFSQDLEPNFRPPPLYLQQLSFLI